MALEPTISAKGILSDGGVGESRPVGMKVNPEAVKCT
jgi:hypothetical protein